MIYIPKNPLNQCVFSFKIFKTNKTELGQFYYQIFGKTWTNTFPVCAIKVHFLCQES